jgi:hypothetical protein
VIDARQNAIIRLNEAKPAIYQLAFFSCLSSDRPSAPAATEQRDEFCAVSSFDYLVGAWHPRFRQTRVMECNAFG